MSELLAARNLRRGIVGLGIFMMAAVGLQNNDRLEQAGESAGGRITSWLKSGMQKTSLGHLAYQSEPSFQINLAGKTLNLPKSDWPSTHFRTAVCHTPDVTHCIDAVTPSESVYIEPGFAGDPRRGVPLKADASFIVTRQLPNQSQQSCTVTLNFLGMGELQGDLSKREQTIRAEFNETSRTEECQK